MDQTTPSLSDPAARAERLASLPAAAAFLRDLQAMTSPGRPLYGLAGNAAETIDQVRRELARMESGAALSRVAAARLRAASGEAGLGMAQS
jgi:hypothetical protein